MALNSSWNVSVGFPFDGVSDMPNEKKTNGGHNNASPPSFQAFYERAIMAFTRKKKRADGVKERE